MKTLFALCVVFVVLVVFAAYESKPVYIGTANIQYSTATNGTVAVNDSKSDIVVIHETALPVLALTVTFPATPVDGQRVSITSVNGITALTATTPVGSLANTLTTILAGGAGTYIFSTAQNKWYRLR